VSNPIRVILADDHPIVRSGIRNLLNRTQDIQVVGESGCGPDVIPMVNELKPDILLLDMELPGMPGVDIARRLQLLRSPVKILVLSGYDDRQYIMQMLELGVSGYLTKDEAPELIVDAVRGVAQGEHGWMSRRVSAQVSAWMLEESRDPKRLTSREIEVLSHLTNGKTNQAIGMELGISEKTVEKYLDTIFRKLGVSSRVNAAVRAVREGLVR
jgi:DNA-binding NarL/FixJ family response regulator